MSRSLKLKSGLMTISGLFLVFTILAFSSRWSFSTPPKQGHRHLATAMKMDRLMEKQLGALSVQLARLDAVPEFDHQEVTLTGYITANATDGSAIHYEWDLPAGVAVVAGDASGELTNMRSGDTAEVELHVTGFSREVGKHIILFGKVRHGQDELTHSALVASRPEDSMEYVAPQMREYAQETRAKEFKNGRLVK